MLVHACGKGCIVLDLQVFLMLIVRGGDTISMMMVAVLFFSGLVWVDFGVAQAHVSGLHVGISS